jgi:protease-4
LENNLQSIFASPFYINKEYAQSLIPVIYSALVLGKTSVKTEKEKELACVSLSSGSQNGGSGVSASNVLVLSIKAPIQKFSNWEYLGTKSFTSILDQYKTDPNVAGAVLDMDSGGGQSYGTPEFYDYILAYPKPIVVYTDGYLCSAAYYIASASNYIIANKRADAIGSIGAYATIVDFNGIWEKHGAKIHTIYATESTEKNADYRQVLEGNYEPYITNSLDPLVKTFHVDMRATRPNLDESVFKGGTWGGEKALELGLVDELGNLQTAIDKVFSLSNLNNNNNQTNTKMSKQLPKVQTVLGLAAALATTDNGSYLNEEQLDLLENRLDALETSEATLKTQLAEAQNSTTLQTELTTANGTIASLETSVDAILAEAGLTATGTVTEKLTLLSGKVTEMSNKDGAPPTKVLVDQGQKEEKNQKVGGIDVSAALNN